MLYFSNLKKVKKNSQIKKLLLFDSPLNSKKIRIFNKNNEYNVNGYNDKQYRYNIFVDLNNNTFYFNRIIGENILQIWVHHSWIVLVFLLYLMIIVTQKKIIIY